MIKPGKLKFYLLTVDATGEFSFLQGKRSLCDRTTYTHILGGFVRDSWLIVQLFSRKHHQSLTETVVSMWHWNS